MKGRKDNLVINPIVEVFTVSAQPRTGNHLQKKTIGGSKGGAKDAPTGVQILSFSCSFRQKNCKIIPIWKLAHPLGKILDPPLKTI